jgi:hypothetical protein
MPPAAWWLFATTPPLPARPVYDIPPVITRRPGWRPALREALRAVVTF